MLPYWWNLKITSNDFSFRYNKNWALEGLLLRWSNKTTICSRKLRLKRYWTISYVSLLLDNRTLVVYAVIFSGAHIELSKSFMSCLMMYVDVSLLDTIAVALDCWVLREGWVQRWLIVGVVSLGLKRHLVNLERLDWLLSAFTLMSGVSWAIWA